MLRPYQIKGENDIRAAFAEGALSPLYFSPTGSGKTEVFLSISHKVSAKNKRVCIIVHRKNLLFQTSRRLRRRGIDHGLIAPNFRYEGQSVAVASVQSLHALIKRLKNKTHHTDYEARLYKLVTSFDLFILDEGHHATAATWRYIIDICQNTRVLGVTATPKRGDGKGLGISAGGIYDRLILGPSVKELIAEGYLCAHKIFIPEVCFNHVGAEKSRRKSKRRGDWGDDEIAEFLNKPKMIGDSIAMYQRICPGEPAIAFCPSVKDAEAVAEKFCAAGFKAKAIHGNSENPEGLLQDLESGRLHVLASCDLIGEGTDIPCVTAVIDMNPTRSEARAIQNWGRVSRPVYADKYDLSTASGRLAAIAASKKPYGIIIDHVGNIGIRTDKGLQLKHGFPDDDREWSLDGEQKSKRAKKEKITHDRIRCDSCFLLYQPSDRCSHCGALRVVQSRVVQQVDGEVKPLTDAEIQAARLAKKKENRSARSVDDLIALGKARGYRNPVAWAKKYWEARRS